MLIISINNENKQILIYMVPNKSRIRMTQRGGGVKRAEVAATFCTQMTNTELVYEPVPVIWLYMLTQ